MFRTHASTAVHSRPVLTDWTTQELLAWIAADDTRSRDETLLPLLTAIDAALPGSQATALTPSSPVPLVRAIARRLRADPALRDVRVRDLPGVGIRSA